MGMRLYMCEQMEMPRPFYSGLLRGLQMFLFFGPDDRSPMFRLSIVRSLCLLRSGLSGTSASMEQQQKRARYHLYKGGNGRDINRRSSFPLPKERGFRGGNKRASQWGSSPISIFLLILPPFFLLSSVCVRPFMASGCRR